MHPVSNERTPGRSLRLRDLVLMMREDEVLTPQVQVDGIS